MATLRARADQPAARWAELTKLAAGQAKILKELPTLAPSKELLTLIRYVVFVLSGLVVQSIQPKTQEGIPLYDWLLSELMGSVSLLSFTYIVHASPSCLLLLMQEAAI